MENASKALIIAAAILIAILLISVGVYIVGVAQEQINNSDMSSIEITTFNKKFTKYEGKQKGSAIRTMIQEVMAYNNSDEASDETMVSVNADNQGLKITGRTPAVDASLISLKAAQNENPTYGTAFKNTKTYNVEVQYVKGRVAMILVRDPNAKVTP